MTHVVKTTCSICDRPLFHVGVFVLGVRVDVFVCYTCDRQRKDR